MKDAFTPAAGGVLYSAVGDAYAAEALRSARSSMRHNRLPHLLFSSVDVDVDSDQGLSVARFEPSANAYLDKVANMRRSPFERSIYLDTDTFVVDEIVHLLRLLDRFDMAVAYEPSLRGRGDPDVPLAFYEFNTGVVVWRSSERMAAFMRSWEETYSAWLRDEPFPGAGKPSARRRATRVPGRDPSWGGAADQPAFRRCAWQHDVRLFVLGPEYNFRLGTPTTVVERVRVIHGRDRDFDALAARINYMRNPRQLPRARPLRVRVKSKLQRIRGESGERRREG